MILTLSSLTLAVLMPASAMGAEQWAVFEASFTSARKYDNPFLDVQVDAVLGQDARVFIHPEHRLHQLEVTAGQYWVTHVAGILPPVVSSHKPKLTFAIDNRQSAPKMAS